MFAQIKRTIIMSRRVYIWFQNRTILTQLYNTVQCTWKGGGGEGGMVSCALLQSFTFIFTRCGCHQFFSYYFFFYPCHVKQKLFCTLHVTFQEFKFFAIYFSFFRGHNGVRSAIASLGCDVRYIDNNVIVTVGVKRSPQTNLGQQHFIDFQCGFSKICPHFWDAHVLSTNMCGMWP